MTKKTKFELGFSMPLAMFLPSLGAIAVALVFFRGPIRQFARESLMGRVTSTHYELLFPAGALSLDAMTQFAAQHEVVFAKIDNKIGDAGSNSKIRVVFDPSFPEAQRAGSDEQAYSITGTTIRTKLNSKSPSLPAVADAEALLYASWGKPGNAHVAQWAAIWLTGEWRGSEIGMAATEVEQKLGHKRLATVLDDPPSELPSLDDQDLLGAAWISETAEFGGGDAVRKVYAARMTHPSIAEVARVLGTTPLELERKWQMWMYAYLAGMPSMPRDSRMPMDMPMAGSH